MRTYGSSARRSGSRATGRWTVVVDPIDGSLNAKRGIPFFSISIAVADGETMDDVVFGYVHDFGSGEEWTATRGGGALLNGQPILERPKDELEILSFEATTTAFVSENAARFDGIAHRLRVMGSLAISLCHLAAGRVDGVVSLKPARARSTSPPPSCSSASRDSRSTCRTLRRSALLRSISLAARGSPLPGTPSSARRLGQALAAPPLRSA